MKQETVVAGQRVDNVPQAQQAQYQPAPVYRPQNTVVVQTQYQQVGQDDGTTRAIIILIVGWFFFPVWWFACCHVCRPGISPLAKSLNTASTILGILWGMWVPAVIVFEIIMFTGFYPSYSDEVGTINPGHVCQGDDIDVYSCAYQCMNGGFYVDSDFDSSWITLTPVYSYGFWGNCTCPSGSGMLDGDYFEPGDVVSGLTFDDSAELQITAYSATDVELYVYDNYGTQVCEGISTYRITSGTVLAFDVDYDSTTTAPTTTWGEH